MAPPPHTARHHRPASTTWRWNWLNHTAVGFDEDPMPTRLRPPNPTDFRGSSFWNEIDAVLVGVGGGGVACGGHRNRDAAAAVGCN